MWKFDKDPFYDDGGPLPDPGEGPFTEESDLNESTRIRNSDASIRNFIGSGNWESDPHIATAEVDHGAGEKEEGHTAVETQHSGTPQPERAA